MSGPEAVILVPLKVIVEEIERGSVHHIMTLDFGWRWHFKERRIRKPGLEMLRRSGPVGLKVVGKTFMSRL
jgi:hypothetical protein